MSDSSDIRVEVTNAGSQAVSVTNATGSTPTVTDGASVIVHVAGGPTGPAGSGITGIGSITDVELTNLSAGDVLRYSSNKWRNYAETSLVDGGNFG